MKDKWSINSKTQKIIKNKRKVRIDLRICEKNLIFVDYIPHVQPRNAYQKPNI